MDEGETIQTIINVEQDHSQDSYLFLYDSSRGSQGTSVADFANIRQNGLKALNLKDEDELINVFLTDGAADVIIGTKFGYSVRFNETAVRNMSRIATGVRGVNLRDGDQVVGAGVVSDNDEVLVITEKVMVSELLLVNIRQKAVVVKGLKQLILQRNGPLAGLMTVNSQDLMIITNTGVIIRTSVVNISQTGRSTMGVKVMRLDQNAQIVTFTTVEADDKEELQDEKEVNMARGSRRAKKKRSRRNIILNILSVILLLVALAPILILQLEKYDYGLAYKQVPGF